MDGIEKITGRIAEDAQREIDELLAQARRQADKILADRREQARREGNAIREKGKRDAVQRVERQASVDQLEGRKLTLGAKQEMIGKAFDKALELLGALPEEDYIELLAALAAQAARTGHESVILSKKDRARVGKAAVTRANELLAKQVSPKLPDELTDTRAGALLNKVVTGASALLSGTAMLTLSEETRPMTGGLILSGGDVEVNCTFETLVRLERDHMAIEVANVLF